MVDRPAPSPRRTRVKICGLTREADVDAAVQAGADAIGMVLYAKSPRALSAARACELARRLPAFVTPVMLLVNPSATELAALRDGLHGAGIRCVLQFHGDEAPAQCEAAQIPYIRAARIPSVNSGGFDLVKFCAEYPGAQAILVDTDSTGYGGSGKTFDWTTQAWSHPTINASSRIVLSGGLTAQNVIEGIQVVRPWAVDVSSGVEIDAPHGGTQKGLKDPQKIIAFIQAVRRADEMLGGFKHEVHGKSK